MQGLTANHENWLTQMTEGEGPQILAEGTWISRKGNDMFFLPAVSPHPEVVLPGSGSVSGSLSA